MNWYRITLEIATQDGHPAGWDWEELVGDPVFVVSVEETA